MESSLLDDLVSRKSDVLKHEPKNSRLVYNFKDFKTMLFSGL